MNEKKRNSEVEAREALAREVLEELNRKDEEKENRLKLEPVKKEEITQKDLYQIINFYHILIENMVFWSSHQDYNLLVQKFLNKEINGFEFQDAFLKLWYSDGSQIRKIIEIIENGDKNYQIPDFFYTSKSMIFLDVICDAFFAAEGYESEENEDYLRSFFQKNYVSPLRKHFDDSFFQLRIDLDKLIEKSYRILYSIAILITGFLLVNF